VRASELTNGRELRVIQVGLEWRHSTGLGLCTRNQIEGKGVLLIWRISQKLKSSLEYMADVDGEDGAARVHDICSLRTSLNVPYLYMET